MFIDTHVHCRDEEQSHKETIAHALQVARDSGLDAIFDMPNTQRPVLSKKRVEERLDLARRADVPEVFYGLYVGLTSDPEQIKQAVAAYHTFFPRVVGMKLYAGHSVGELGVTRLEEQELVYDTLAREGYQGLLFVHAEKESEMNEHIGKSFNPKRPMTHCRARPWKAEYSSIQDQIALVERTRFMGKLHITHLSHPKSLDLVVDARGRGVDISSSVCPHHLFYDSRQMEQKNGLLWKMNPPLRTPASSSSLLEALRNGKTDWIETDHAPHSLDEKMMPPYLSGIPGLPWWPQFTEYLRTQNFTEQQIENLTFRNIISRFKIHISSSRRSLKDHRSDYSFNPYSSLERFLQSYSS